MLSWQFGSSLNYFCGSVGFFSDLTSPALCVFLHKRVDRVESLQFAGGLVVCLCVRHAAVQHLTSVLTSLPANTPRLNSEVLELFLFFDFHQACWRDGCGRCHDSEER